MARTRYISNARKGVRGSLVEGNVIYTTGPGMGIEIYEADTTAKYDIGTRLVTGDGRVLRYAKATNEIKSTNYGLKFWDQLSDGIGYKAPLYTQVVGDRTVSVNAGKSVTKDELKGGYIIIHTHHTYYYNQNRLIIGNTKSDGSNYVTITVDGPWTIAIETAFGVETLRNPYGNVQLRTAPLGTGGDGYSSVAGMPMCETTAANQYLWLQTWGPIWVNPTGTSLLTTDDSDERQLVFDHEGSVCIFDDALNTTAHMQNAGFIIDRIAAGSSGPPLVMLQVSP